MADPLPATTTPRALRIAILALGGQGGGVLADWLVRLGEDLGWYAQATSVPGVAQRTGATIYYVELFPPVAGEARAPVLALMPVPGDVDVVVASELMEAGRAVLRGLVDRARTVVVTSTHRIYAIAEKSALGDGTADGDRVLTAVRERARAFFGFDMDAVAESTGSVISAVMLGALAASDALPFSREQFEAAIRGSGVGVEDSLRGFAAGFAAATSSRAEPSSAALPHEPTTVRGRELRRRIEAELPQLVRTVAIDAVKRLVDYQDFAYANLYLDCLRAIVRVDVAAREWALSALVARHLALWMSYEDVIRVADLKTRTERFRRVREEVRATEGQIVHVAEFMHPRLEEVCDLLTPGLARWLRNSARLQRALAPLFRSGRRVRTSSISGFLVLHTLSGLRRWRRGTSRYADEQVRIDEWLGLVRATAPLDYGLAREIAACQQLVKGYSDTHARGLASYRHIIDAIPLLRAGGDKAAQVKRLREAALSDDTGKALERALAASGPIPEPRSA